MELNIKQIEFENKFKILINESIDKIYYELLNYEFIKEFDNSATKSNYLENQYNLNGLHSIGLSVILKACSNKLYQITWDSDFFHYGISIKEIESIPIKEMTEIINVSDNEKIAPYLNKKISDVNIDWSYVEIEPENLLEKLVTNKRIYYPQTAVLNFESLQLYISAAEIKDNGEVYGFSDNLLLAFDKEIARQYKLID